MSAVPKLAAAVLIALLLSGCGGIRYLDPVGNDPVVRGSASYRERIALPPDAMLVVTLADTTPVIMSSPIVAEVVLRVGGAQPPLAFELPFERTRINRDHYYGVRAAIRSGEQVLFETAGAQPVITRDNPKRVDLLLVRAAAATAAPAPALVGTTWRLEDLAGAGVIDRTLATLEFPEAGSVVGQGTCNRFFGQFEASGSALKITRLGATKKMCPPAVMDQETKYLRALEGAQRFEIEGRTLRVYSTGLDRPLRFVTQ
jgi:putative lipoprotein